MIKVNVTWYSTEDRLEGSEFNLERKAKLDEMQANGLIPSNGRPNTANENPVGIVLFTTDEAAIEWENFIQRLAKKYSKIIISITKENV